MVQNKRKQGRQETEGQYRSFSKYFVYRQYLGYSNLSKDLKTLEIQTGPTLADPKREPSQTGAGL